MTAKLCGIKVHEFAVGMGPAFFKRKRGETLYSLRVFPIGGFCKMEGEEESSEDAGSFSSKPLYKRFLVVIAGSFMNFVAGFIIIAIMIGLAGFVGGTTVAAFRPDMESYPTREAGLCEGDRIISIGGSRMNIAEDISYYLTSRGEEPLDVVIERDNKRITLEAVQFPYKMFDKAEITGNAKDKGIPYKMVYTDFYVEPQNVNAVNILPYAFYKSVSMGKAIWISLADMIRGKVAVSELSGPIGVGSAISQATKNGAKSLFTLIAFISINLGVMNLLPLPALDGGRIVFMIFELIARRPVPPEKENMVHFIGFALFILLAIFIAYQDIIKLAAR